jgi:hypothetical protein
MRVKLRALGLRVLHAVASDYDYDDDVSVG